MSTPPSPVKPTPVFAKIEDNKEKETETILLGKKHTYKIENEQELKKIEIDKNIIFRLIDINGKKMVDIRRYYKGFPTKKGIRFDYESFKEINNII